MTLRIEQVYLCDCCRMECSTPFIQEVKTGQVQMVIPRESQNCVIYQGYVVDLCMMCMAPVHQTLKEKLEKEYKGGVDPQ